MVVLIRRRINDLISELKLFQCWPPSHISRQCAGLLFQFLAVVVVLFEDTEQFSNSFAEDIGKLSEQDLQPACFSACFSLVFFSANSQSSLGKSVYQDPLPPKKGKTIFLGEKGDVHRLLCGNREQIDR